MIDFRPLDRFRFPVASAAALAVLALSPALAAAPHPKPAHQSPAHQVAAAAPLPAPLPRPRPRHVPPPAAVTGSSEAPEAPAGAPAPAAPSATGEASETAGPSGSAAPADAAAAPPAENADAGAGPGPANASPAADSTEPATASDSGADSAPVPHPRPPDGEATAEEEPDADSTGNAEAAEAGDAAPLPRPRPELSATDAARLLATQFYGFTPDFALRSTLDAVRDGRYADARQMAATHPNPLVAALVDWLIARQPDSGMSAKDVIDVLSSHRDWPEPEQLQLRAEQAFHALGPSGASVIAFYNLAEPMTVGGKLALAGALRDAGRGEESAAIVRDLWRNWSLGSGQAASVLARFGSDLSVADHLYRFRRLVLRGRDQDAAAQAELLGPGYDDLATAVIAVLDRRKDAAQLLSSVAPQFFSDPLYVFARVHLLLRSGEPIEAARFLLESRPDLDLSGDADIWWDERQDLARALLDRDTPDLAYRVAATAQPDGDSERVSADFHAGWIALRFLHNPSQAEPHFRDLHTIATLPRTRARASYWLGRTHEAEDRPATARLDYAEAAQFGGTFYGQLARQKLGILTTGLERLPKPSALDRLRFADRDTVKVVRLLASAGYADMATPFLTELGESVDTPGEVALLTTLARRIGQPAAGIRAAAEAEERGLKVACLPALFFGVPSGLRTPEAVDRTLVYAVVRQESAFDHTAVSHAGALGLMQLMPATARATARNAQMAFSEQRLTTDPLYNATLGAHHLGDLLGGLNRSYILTFAAYNAGAGRALQWIRDYGDPRGGAVDPIDWIERIPFDETRDYVQKVMENLQLYRSRTGHPLSLSEDLVRGGPQG